MYRSFAVLSVIDEAELRDPSRLRRLHRHYYIGLAVAVFALGISGFLLCCLGVGMLYRALTAPIPVDRTAGWALAGVSFFFGPLFCVMAAAFNREWKGSPLLGYAAQPEAYAFAPAKLTGAKFHNEGKRPMQVIRVIGKFEKGNFRTDFGARIWSNAVQDKGEKKHLREGDDRFDQKGRRQPLPVEAWVIYRKDAVWNAALAGLPAEWVKKVTV